MQPSPPPGTAWPAAGPTPERLCLWDLPPRDLGVLLLAMIETGDGAGAYYTDIMQAVANLSLAAPGGPPGNAASFVPGPAAGQRERPEPAFPQQLLRPT